jgi:hypothetical protein
MTPFEMEEQIRNLNQWAAEVAQILPTLATKDDLKAFATKEDLKAFATKEDLKAFATKEELRASIDALRGELTSTLATKADVADARRYALMLNETTRDDIRLLAEHMLTMQGQLRGMQTQLDRIETRLP